MMHFISCSSVSSEAVRHSLRDREVRGSIPGRVKTKDFKAVTATAAAAILPATPKMLVLVVVVVVVVVLVLA
ncbi:hypothetical protein ElyMa_002279900 [Elysia marginata]|uniref:Uncharacterized protein n=1 Tax=Elysia marginata TaxID=1093978 RepID=A0AAV4G0F5_9GAST|nr:hypothetical protein ElyMa_002279900 [Elysia marginata]